MCDGASAIALAGLIIGAATTTYSTIEQDKTVKAQNRINQQAADEGAALASEAFKDQANSARLRDSQEAEAAAKDKFENSKAAAQARETARVSAGEAGVSGVSVDNLIADYYKQELGYTDAVNRNLEFSQDQTTSELKGLRSGAIDRSIASKRPLINRPSYLAAGASIANNALSSYDTYKYRTDPAYRGEK
jgi:hypothetical protein